MMADDTLFLLDESMAEMAAQHNDVNFSFINTQQAPSIIKESLDITFAGCQKIAQKESENNKY